MKSLMKTLLISTNQKLACPDRAGRSCSIIFFFRISFKMTDAKALFDFACDCVLDHFKAENLKVFQWKALEKLLNGEDVFVSVCADGF